MPFRFLRFPVYKDAKEFISEILLVANQLSKNGHRELASHLKNSAISVALNIAEGSDKGSDKDFNRYIMMSLGSLNEAMAALDIANESGCIKKEIYDFLLPKAEHLAKQLGGFSKSLKGEK